VRLRRDFYHDRIAIRIVENDPVPVPTLLVDERRYTVGADEPIVIVDDLVCRGIAMRLTVLGSPRFTPPRQLAEFPRFPPLV